MNTIGSEYLNTVIRRLKYYKSLGEKAFEQLEEKDFHFQPGEASNSIAVIVQHMAGNMLSRFTNFLTEDGEKEWRRRDEEFEMHHYSKIQVIEIWEKGWKCFFDALNVLHEKDLLHIVNIRKEPLTVMDAMNRQLAHYAYHIGQITLTAKMIKGKEWKSLSIPKGQSNIYNQATGMKDPAKQF